MEKTCSICKNTLPLEFYYRTQFAARSMCKRCHNQKPRSPARDVDATLYIMSNSLLPGLYKVGRTKDVDKRAEQLMVSHPFRIVTVATFPEAGRFEKQVHELLAGFKVRTGPGTEWFRCELRQILLCIHAALPADLGQLVTQRGRHAVELTDSEAVVSSCSASCGASLCADGMSAEGYEFARTGLAANVSGDVAHVVPDCGELPVAGEVSGGVLAVGEQREGDACDDLSVLEEGGPRVFEQPANGFKKIDYLESLRY